MSDDWRRKKSVYFLKHKSDAAEVFEQLLVGVRANGAFSAVELACPDGSGVHEGDFGAVCRTRGTQQELPTADIPQFNGVAARDLGSYRLPQRQLGYMRSSSFQTPTCQTPRYSGLSRNVGHVSPSTRAPPQLTPTIHPLTRCGTIRQSLKLLPLLLKPGHYRRKRANKS